MAHDTADLRQLMRMALLASDDKDMIEVLQVGREEMPEAIKTLQRALEKEVVAAGNADGKKAVPSSAGVGGVGLGISTPAQAQVPGSASAADEGGLERRGTVASRESGGSGSGSSGKDTLDREFIESGIDVLRRMSQVTEASLPSWTITRCVFYFTTSPFRLLLTSMFQL
jgi:abelson tyrosine-protein kinase 1